MTCSKPANVLFVVAKKPIPANLLNSPLIGEISVITDEESRGIAPPSARVATVSNIRHFDAVVQEARRLHASRAVQRVISPGERGVPAAGAVRSDLGIPGTSAVVARAFSDKHFMKARLRDADVPTAPFDLAASVSDTREVGARLGWPIVIKPLYGGGADDVVKVDGEDHLATLRREGALDGLAASPWPVMVERYVHPTIEFHCDAVVHDGHIVFAATSRYFLPMLGHHSDLTGTVFLDDDDPYRAGLLDLNQQTIAALGLVDGVTHLEAFGTDSGLVVGEIACRPAGAKIVDGIRAQWGVDLWDAFLRTEFGLVPQVRLDRSDGILATVWLPVRPGRVTEIVEADRLRALAGVERVEMDHSVGDVIGPDLHAVSMAGAVFLRGRDMAEALARVEDVRNAYVFEVEPA